MAGKDPATLWYWNDWIGGTMTMTRQAKGAYMDLLTAQFNSGHLTETQIKTLLGQDQGLWATVLREKFLVDGGGKYYNKRLDDEIQKRKSFVSSRGENGKKGGRPKKNKPLGYPYGKPNGKLPEDENEITNEKKDEGIGEEKNEAFIVPGMMATWKEKNPKAFIRLDDDFPIMLDIAKSLKEWMELEGDIVLDENAEKIKYRWGEIVEFLCMDSFLKNYSLVQISKHLASVIQSFNNRVNGTTKSNSNGSATSRSVASLLSGVGSGLTDSEDMDREED